MWVWQLCRGGCPCDDAALNARTCLRRRDATLQVSFEMSEYTAEVDGIGTLRLMNAIRTCGLEKTTRFYQVRWVCRATRHCSPHTLDDALGTTAAP